MIDLTKPHLELAATTERNSGVSEGPLMISKDDMLLQLLDELIGAWTEMYTPIEIGSDLQKVRVLKQARAAISEGSPSERVQQLYREVFLRDVWSGSGAGRTT